MRFWNEMQDKFGFADGEAMPDGIELYRSLYIRSVNRLAEALGSQVRAVAYDRFGLHNSCLILFYRLEDLEQQGIQDFTKPINWLDEKEAEIDIAMQTAIEQVYDLEVDSLVYIRLAVADDFEEFLSDLPNTLPPHEIGDGSTEKK